VSPTRRQADRLAEIEAQHPGRAAELGCEQCTLVTEIQRLRAEIEHLRSVAAAAHDPGSVTRE
jgi:hypothetical protein